jgi:hypothetical protein
MYFSLRFALFAQNEIEHDLKGAEKGCGKGGQMGVATASALTFALQRS